MMMHHISAFCAAWVILASYSSAEIAEKPKSSSLLFVCFILFLVLKKGIAIALHSSFTTAKPWIVKIFEDLKINYANAIIQIMRNRYIDVYIVGDKLQSISFENNK